MNEEEKKSNERLSTGEFEGKLVTYILKIKKLTRTIYDGEFDFEKVKEEILGELKEDLRVILNQFPQFWENKGEGMTAEAYLAAIYGPLEADFNKQSVDGAMDLIRVLDRKIYLEPEEFLASDDHRKKVLEISTEALLGDAWYYVFHVLSNRIWPPPPVVHERIKHDDYGYYREGGIRFAEEPPFTPEQEEQMTIFFDSLSSPVDPMFLTDGYREAYLKVIDRYDDWSPGGFDINQKVLGGMDMKQVVEETVHKSRFTVKLKNFSNKEYPTDEELKNLIPFYESHWQKNPHTKVGLFYKRRMDFYKKVQQIRELFGSRFISEAF